MGLILEGGYNFSNYAGEKGYAGELSKIAQDRLRNELKDIVALKMDADPKSILKFLIKNRNSVEGTCFLESQGKPLEFILEDETGTTKGELLERYNVSIDTTGKMLAAYLYFFSENPQKLKPKALLREHVYPEMQRVCLESYTNINPAIAVNSFVELGNRVMKDEPHKFLDIGRAAETFINFMGTIREYEYWIPQITDFRRRYQEKIGI